MTEWYVTMTKMVIIMGIAVVTSSDGFVMASFCLRYLFRWHS